MPLGPHRLVQDQKRQQNQADAQLLGEGRIGDDSVTAEELRAMGSLVAARHLMTLLAKKRVDRQAALQEVGDLLLALEDGRLVRRLLLQMGDAGRIVDIYPLEVMAYVLDQEPSLLKDIEFGSVILNKVELEARTFDVEEVITIKVPLSLKMRSFALEGGGMPGYCFAPSMPGEYRLELADSGEFQLLVRGDIRKKSFIDQALLRIQEDPPGRS